MRRLQSQGIDVRAMHKGPWFSSIHLQHCLCQVFKLHMNWFKYLRVAYIPLTIFFLNKSGHVIRSIFFILEVSFLAFLAIHTKRKRWPDGNHSILIAESSCVCMPSCRSVDPIFFQTKVPFWDFLKNIKRGVAISIH